MKSEDLSDNVYILRMIACCIWLAAGIAAGEAYGFASAFASFLFIIALIMEKEHGDKNE